MRCKLPLGVALAAALVVAGSTTAQQTPPSSAGVTYTPGTFYPPYYNGGYYGGGGGWGWGGWGWGGGVGSTAAGSYLTGLGNAIRAQGQYNLDTSAAAINLAEARRREIENRKQWTNTYFEMREINRAYRQKERAPPESASAWVRRAQEAAPDRLTPGELDPVTGRITWPSGLAAADFTADREKLDVLFADRALADGAIGLEAHSQIRGIVDSMLATLRSHIQDFPVDQYVASRRFLVSLRHEASLPVAAMTTASREPVPPPAPAN
jgi:hypothetical protein